MKRLFCSSGVSLRIRSTEINGNSVEMIML